MTRILLAAAAYVVVVFPLALAWHLGLFKEEYQAFGYFAGEPNVPVGLAAVVIQGVVLSFIYPLFRPGRAGFGRAFQFAGLMGLFFWTSHVLALVAKQNVPNAGGFIAMETGYLVAQFGLFALVLGLDLPARRLKKPTNRNAEVSSHSPAQGDSTNSQQVYNSGATPPGAAGVTWTWRGLPFWSGSCGGCGFRRRRSCAPRSRRTS